MLKKQEQKERDQRQSRRMTRQENKELKLSRKVREMIENKMKDAMNNLRDEFIDRFEKMLGEMQEEGKMFGADFISIELKDFRLGKLKALGKKGWKFAFIVDSKVADVKDQVVLTRERALGGKDE